MFLLDVSCDIRFGVVTVFLAWGGGGGGGGLYEDVNINRSINEISNIYKYANASYLWVYILFSVK